MNLTEEKYQKISGIIEKDKKVISSSDIIKINRTMSYLTLFIKDVYDFIDLKTLDNVFYYKLRLKNNYKIFSHNFLNEKK